MTTGYTGSYRGMVIDNQDPMGERRLRVQVPELSLDDLGWARASLPPGEVTAPPAVGEVVWVSFEAGDTDYPVWQVEASHVLPPAGSQGYGGMYRGVVEDNLDPEQRGRLLVVVPEIGLDRQWAAPDPGLSVTEVPAVGAAVWIEFEYGDPQYPRWVGVA
jgi:hypothetical protein